MLSFLRAAITQIVPMPLPMESGMGPGHQTWNHTEEV
jgi:hypothetical protein